MSAEDPVEGKAAGGRGPNADRDLPTDPERASVGTQTEPVLLGGMPPLPYPWVWTAMPCMAAPAQWAGFFPAPPPASQPPPGLLSPRPTLEGAARL